MPSNDDAAGYDTITPAVEAMGLSSSSSASIATTGKEDLATARKAVDYEIVSPAAAAAAASSSPAADEEDAVVTQEQEPVFHPDGNREIRSMILAALPVPPMPILACKELGDERSYVEAELKAISSHDLLAHLMNICCTVVSSARNEQRRIMQEKLQEDELFSKLDAWQEKNDPGGEKQLLPPVELSYSILGNFTRKYVQSYMQDPNKVQDVRFIPLQDVDREHVVYRKALEFHRAQDVLYGPCCFAGGLGEKMPEYAELVQHSVRRILASSASL